MPLHTKEQDDWLSKVLLWLLYWLRLITEEHSLLTTFHQGPSHLPKSLFGFLRNSTQILLVLPARNKNRTWGINLTLFPPPRWVSFSRLTGSRIPKPQSQPFRQAFPVQNGRPGASAWGPVLSPHGPARSGAWGPRCPARGNAALFPAEERLKSSPARLQSAALISPTKPVVRLICFCFYKWENCSKELFFKKYI